MKRIAILFTSILVLSVCTIGGPPSTPTGLTASEDLHNKIELSWTEDANAGVYHVFRGTASGLEGTAEEYLGSTSMNAYIDTTVATDVPYWYAVSAADPFGENETALSDEAEGIAPDLIWSMPVTVAESAAAAVLAPGGTNPMIVTAAAADGAISRHEYDEETGWTAAADSPGTADDPSNITAAVIGGELHVAYTASADGAGLTVRSYAGEEEGWQTLGEADTDSEVSGPISLAGSGFPANEVYLGYLDGTATSAVITKYYSDTAGVWTTLGTPALPNASTLLLHVFNGNTYIFFEDNSSPGLAGKVFEDTTGWNDILDSSVGNIEDGYMAATSGTNGIYLAYSVFSSDSLSVIEYAPGAWSDLGSIPNVDTGGPVDLAVLNGTLYAAYVTATATVVSRYVDEAWETTAFSDDDTLSAADSLDMEVHGGSLRLLTVTAGKTEVRVFE